jgi:hypothetical protein
MRLREPQVGARAKTASPGWRLHITKRRQRAFKVVGPRGRKSHRGGLFHASVRSTSGYTFSSKTLTILRTYGMCFRGLRSARLLSYEPASIILIMTLRTPQ